MNLQISASNYGLDLFPGTKLIHSIYVHPHCPRIRQVSRCHTNELHRIWAPKIRCPRIQVPGCVESGSLVLLCYSKRSPFFAVCNATETSYPALYNENILVILTGPRNIQAYSQIGWYCFIHSSDNSKAVAVIHLSLVGGHSWRKKSSRTFAFAG